MEELPDLMHDDLKFTVWSELDLPIYDFRLRLVVIYIDLRADAFRVKLCKRTLSLPVDNI